MGIKSTVVFTDLHGSTAAFGALGNARATVVITQILDQITALVYAHQGQLVKKLGDGVMAVFGQPGKALDFAVQVQRVHSRHLYNFELRVSLPVKIGIAFGDTEFTAGDYYGDAVNVAARLCDLAGPSQIWASKGSVDVLTLKKGVSVRAVGNIAIRGRSENCEVLQVEWKEDEQSDFLTMQAQIMVGTMSGKDVLGKQVDLSYREKHMTFRSFELPAHIGRVKSAEFVVGDPRVSRMHARLVWRNGGVLVEDLSTYGTWVRFADDSSGEILLRRDECVLHGSGELGLGASFGDSSAPVVSFSVS